MVTVKTLDYFELSLCLFALSHSWVQAEDIKLNSSLQSWNSCIAFVSLQMCSLVTTCLCGLLSLRDLVFQSSLVSWLQLCASCCKLPAILWCFYPLIFLSLVKSCFVQFVVWGQRCNSFCVFQFMCPTSEQQLAKCTVELASLLGKSVMKSCLRLKCVVNVLLNPWL